MNLYNKYRPKTLDEVLGNSLAVMALRQAFKKETVPPVMMFCGPTGCGKTTLARIVKEELGCSDSNFNELNMSNTRGIDTIREVIQFSQYGTFDGGAKIFLFDECHKLTPDAQNAMLKMLEDVIPGVYYILCTTDPQKIIETVRKRCIIYVVSPLSQETIVKMLKKICDVEGKKVRDDVLKEVARASEGLPRQSLLMLENVINLPPEEGLLMVRDMEIGSAEVLDICRALVKKPKWKEIQSLLTKVDILEPEKARVSVMNYLTTTFLRSGDEKFARMMEHFKEPCINAGRGGFVLACWKACKEE